MTTQLTIEERAEIWRKAYQLPVYTKGGYRVRDNSALNRYYDKLVEKKLAEKRGMTVAEARAADEATAKLREDARKAAERRLFRAFRNEQQQKGAR